MTAPIRKRRVTYNIAGHAHFLTYSCFKRFPLLTRDRTREWVIGALSAARQKFDFALWAYVVMPEHVHALIWPRSKSYQMSGILAALKRPVSTQATQHLLAAGNFEWLRKLTVFEGGAAVFRFWLPGGGYDRNLWNDRPIQETIEYIPRAAWFGDSGDRLALVQRSRLGWRPTGPLADGSFGPLSSWSSAGSHG